MIHAFGNLVFSSAVLAILLCGVVCAETPSTNYDESKVGTYTLPDPLTFNNGKKVRNAKDWSKRRGELLELFAANVYGHIPAKPAGKLRYEVLEQSDHALDGKAIRRQVRIYFSDKNNGPKEDLLLYIPTGAQKPAPAILTLNFRGNQAAIADPAVRLPIRWNPKTHQPETAPEDTRGTDTYFDIAKVVNRGYALATIFYGDIEPDFNGGYPHGIRPLFLKPGQTEPGEEDWGAISAWAYGLSRGLDYLEKDHAIDAKRVAVMGHSRQGKTALWAGAIDQRFAMVLASCPGEGGASLARRNYGETLRDLSNHFPYWFDKKFQSYADNPNALPVDMHELIALSAPRPVYVTSAEQDRWADPKGEFLACVAAGPVYRLLGAEDLGTDQMPGLNQPIAHTIGFHYRTGKHEVTSYDWDQFLSFADAHLRAR